VFRVKYSSCEHDPASQNSPAPQGAARDVAMNVAAIQESLHRQPFQPFTLRLADGRTVPVPHPAFIAVSQRTVMVIRPDFSILEPLWIVSIEGGASTTTSSNGSLCPNR
jgi:hypothetical protein